MMKPAMIALGLVAAGAAGAAVWAMSETAPASPQAATPQPAQAQQMAQAPAATSAAATVAADPLAINAHDRVEGSMMAPVTIIEYASLTCHHCADFNAKTLPQVRKEWLATGKAKFVFRDMPWDNLALGMAKVTRCVPATRHKPMVDALFAAQPAIMKASDPLVEIKRVAADVAGLSGEQVDACIKDADLHTQVTSSKDTAFNRLGVRGTPTLFVNGEVLNGAVPYGELKKALEAAHAKATGKK